jgi:hypothetical protein
MEVQVTDEKIAMFLTILSTLWDDKHIGMVIQKAPKELKGDPCLCAQWFVETGVKATRMPPQPPTFVLAWVRDYLELPEPTVKIIA